jgi:hypothetical protein
VFCVFHQRKFEKKDRLEKLHCSAGNAGPLVHNALVAGGALVWLRVKQAQSTTRSAMYRLRIERDRQMQMMKFAQRSSALTFLSHTGACRSLRSSPVLHCFCIS